MLKCLSSFFIVLSLFVFYSFAYSQPLGLGRPATYNEVSSWDIDIRPDGKGLPVGSGSVIIGEELYTDNCASCHGDEAQGLEMMAAPRLAGQNDWYLVAQLENFAAGKRGYAPGDHGGRQMKAMMGVLKNSEDYRDVVAYINTLSQ